MKQEQMKQEQMKHWTVIWIDLRRKRNNCFRKSMLMYLVFSSQSIPLTKKKRLNAKLRNQLLIFNYHNNKPQPDNCRQIITLHMHYFAREDIRDEYNFIWWLFFYSCLELYFWSYDLYIIVWLYPCIRIVLTVWGTHWGGELWLLIGQCLWGWDGPSHTITAAKPKP